MHQSFFDDLALYYSMYVNKHVVKCQHNGDNDTVYNLSVLFLKLLFDSVSQTLSILIFDCFKTIPNWLA